MSTTNPPASPWSGTGIVGRLGGNVLVAGGSLDDETARALVELCERASGSELVRELGRLVLETAGDGPDIGVVTDGGGRAMVFLRGRMAFRGTVGAEHVELRGEYVVTWVDRALDGPAEAFDLGPDGAEPSTDDLLDLREGVVRGGGISVGTRAGEEPPAPEGTAPETTSSEAFEPDPSFHSIPIEPDPSLVQEREPLPVDDAGNPDPTEAPRDPDMPAPAVVKGYRCSRNHHNRPGAHYCSACGIKMGVHKTLVAVDGERPPLGVLVFDDGVTISVLHDMVVGREPEVEDAVQAGTAQPIRVEDESQSVSRAHLRVELEEWDAYVVDLGSSNGTRVQRQDGEDWIELTPQARQLIETGTVIMLGEREMRFAQHHVR
ncbi:MAG: FHA domain-containing protein [Miltoncostaeaceae bacterium]